MLFLGTGIFKMKENHIRSTLRMKAYEGEKCVMKI